MKSIKFCWSIKQWSAGGALNACTSNLTLYYLLYVCVRMCFGCFYVCVCVCGWMYRSEFKCLRVVYGPFTIHHPPSTSQYCPYCIHINSWQLFCIYMLFESHLVHFYMLIIERKAEGSWQHSRKKRTFMNDMKIRRSNSFVFRTYSNNRKKKNNKNSTENEIKEKSRNKNYFVSHLFMFFFCFVLFFGKRKNPIRIYFH